MWVVVELEYSSNKEDLGIRVTPALMIMENHPERTRKLNRIRTGVMNKVNKDCCSPNP